MATADGRGYWLVAADGGIFAFGDAGFYGSMGGQPLNAPVVDLAPTPDGRGYWLVATDGGVFAFGDAALPRIDGRAAPQRPGGGHGRRPRHRAATGWWPATAASSPSAPRSSARPAACILNQPVNGMAATANGGGYWFVASDGGIFAFGDAALPGQRRQPDTERPGGGDGRRPVPPAATGWSAGDGGVFAFGAPFFGAG